jgi:hypothetical protein
MEALNIIRKDKKPGLDCGIAVHKVQNETQCNGCNKWVDHEYDLAFYNENYLCPACYMKHVANDYKDLLDYIKSAFFWNAEIKNIASELLVEMEGVKR